MITQVQNCSEPSISLRMGSHDVQPEQLKNRKKECVWKYVLNHTKPFIFRIIWHFCLISAVHSITFSFCFPSFFFYLFYTINTSDGNSLTSHLSNAQVKENNSPTTAKRKERKMFLLLLKHNNAPTNTLKAKGQSKRIRQTRRWKLFLFRKSMWARQSWCLSLQLIYVHISLSSHHRS